VASVTVAAVTVSVPALVWSVNASSIVAAPPGASVTLRGSAAPFPTVVVGVAADTSSTEICPLCCPVAPLSAR
jgi:hypothetical protein